MIWRMRGRLEGKVRGLELGNEGVKAWDPPIWIYDDFIYGGYTICTI
jgi:hypothetical protein